MLEDIKKEIGQLTKYLNTSLDYDKHKDRIETFIVVKRDAVFEILDKYKGGWIIPITLDEKEELLKYKNAWEELKTLAPIYFICSRMEKIEQKHNISKEME